LVERQEAKIMGKPKTRKAVAKRFRKTATGKVKRQHGGKGHLLNSKSRKRKRHLSKSVVVAPGFQKALSIALGRS
jgi:large subunit ribosomal protein L35